MVDGSVNPAITTWDVLKEMLWNNGINYHQPQLVIGGFLNHQTYQTV